MKEYAGKDASYAFAEKIVNTGFDQLPVRAVEAAKKSLLDTLGVMVGATGTTPALRGIAELAAEMGGRTEATIIGFGAKAPAMMAAFANGAMAHCLDYDDIEYKSVYHPSGAVVPAGFAIAEKNRPLSGKEFITAIALGQDLGIRMALAIPPQRKPPWHRAVVVGTFAAAATAAKILRLDTEHVVDTLGNALCQAAGSLELRWGVGTDLGGMYAGFSAKAGVFSALLAEKGIGGIKSSFDGKAGFFNLYFDGKCDRDKLLSGLGQNITGAETALKPWPACAANNTYVFGTLDLMREHHIRADDIERITVYVGDYAQKNCEPLAARRRPVSAPDAKFSLPFSVAVAAVKGNLSIDSFSPSALEDREILAMTERIDPEYDAKFDISAGMPPGALRIKTKQGKTFHVEKTLPYGHPDSPLSWDQIKLKAVDCFGHGLKPISAENVNKVVTLCENLEHVRDIAEIMELLA